MADAPKLPGFWSGKNIFGSEPTVESFSYTFPSTFLEGAGLPFNDPFMRPDLTTVEPTDIVPPEDIFRDIPTSLPPLRHIPGPPAETYRTAFQYSDPLRGDPRDFKFRKPPTGGGRFLPLLSRAAIPLAGVSAPVLFATPTPISEGQTGERRYVPTQQLPHQVKPLLDQFGYKQDLDWIDTGTGNIRQRRPYKVEDGKKTYTGGWEDVPVSSPGSRYYDPLAAGYQQLPHNVYQPQKEPGFFDRTRSFLSGLIPEAGASQAPSFRRTEGISLGRPFEGFWGADYPSPSRAFDITDDSLDKQITGNPLSQYYETLNLPRSEIPTVVRPEVTFNPPTTWGEGNILQRTRGPLQEQRFIDTLLGAGDVTSLGPGVTTPPYGASKEEAEEWFENLPSVVSTPEESSLMLREERVKEIKKKPRESRTSVEEQEIVASEVTRALMDADKGKPVKEELQAIVELAQIDPTIARKYTSPGSQELIDITSQVESFADIPAVKKVVKKKVKKVKPGPKKATVKAKVSKAPPRRVKYTPPKPKPAPRRVIYTPPEDPFAFEDRRGGRR